MAYMTFFFHGLPVMIKKLINKSLHVANISDSSEIILVTSKIFLMYLKALRSQGSAAVSQTVWSASFGIEEQDEVNLWTNGHNVVAKVNWVDQQYHWRLYV